MYKLGFTTRNSAKERLAYQGNGDEKLIDVVLCFVYLEDAWDVEQELHQLFAKKALFYGGQHELMPLLGNGQSELYREDILGMDATFTADQAENTRVNIMAANFRGYGATEEKVQELVRNQEEQYRYRSPWQQGWNAPVVPHTFFVKALVLILRPVFWLLFGLFYVVFRLFYPDDRSSQERIKSLLGRINEACLNRNKRDTALADIAHAKALRLLDIE